MWWAMAFCRIHNVILGSFKRMYDHFQVIMNDKLTIKKLRMTHGHNLALWTTLWTTLWMSKAVANLGFQGQGGCRIPRRRGRQTSRRGLQHINLPDFPQKRCQMFPQNCIKLRTFWSVGWRPLGSATGFPPGGAPTLKVDVTRYYLANFFPKRLHEI